jgi:hypothetical protein
VEEDLPVFLISIDFDKSIAAKLKGMWHIFHSAVYPFSHLLARIVKTENE